MPIAVNTQSTSREARYPMFTACGLALPMRSASTAETYTHIRGYRQGTYTRLANSTRGTTLVHMYNTERLDPELAPMAPMFEKFLDLDDIPATRAQLAAMLGQMAASAPKADDIDMHDEMAPGPKRAPDVMVRIYRPASAKGVTPGVFFIHGGGMVLGDVAGSDLQCQALARDTGYVVASVEYRLAPEHPYPAPLEDCYAGLKWFFANAARLEVDPNRIAVMGPSAGGGLSAGVCLMARDKKEVNVAYQVLIYPMLDDTNVKSAKAAKNDFYVWSRANNRAGWKAYLGARFGGDKVPAYAAPARAKNVSGLPPTYICSGDMDLFLQEDLAYAGKLAAAGVPLDLHIYPGAFHGFDSLGGAAGISRRATADIVRALRTALK
jgi:acetyl esterase/lipase